jgi:hypothetical protein
MVSSRSPLPTWHELLYARIVEREPDGDLVVADISPELDHVVLAKDLVAFHLHVDLNRGGNGLGVHGHLPEKENKIGRPSSFSLKYRRYCIKFWKLNNDFQKLTCS